MKVLILYYPTGEHIHAYKKYTKDGPVYYKDETRKEVYNINEVKEL